MTVATPIVTFLSDFGQADWFVGVVHGVLYETCPGARIVDLTHTVEPGDVDRASFILEAAARDFPAGSIHLAVIDPGVGTARRALGVAAHGQFFVGPDNGLLEWAFTDPAAVCHSLENPRWFRQPVSRTFHGRDVFAPVAAHLAGGQPLESFGPRVADPMRRTRPISHSLDGELTGCVMFIDRFGNALTNITADALATAFPSASEERIEVELCGRRIGGISRSYGDSPIGTLVAIVDSSGKLEIAQVGGDASSRFGFGRGDRVVVRMMV